VDQLLAFTLVAIAVVYSEPGSGGLFFGYVLPLAGIVSACYLLRFAGALIVLVGATAFCFMDISSPSLIRSLALPCLLGLSVMALGIWAWREGYLTGGAGWSDPGGGFDGGGDCGGDGGGC